MSSNVVPFLIKNRVAPKLPLRQPHTADVISLSFERDAELERTLTARRRFAAAETLWDSDNDSTAAITMMLELALESRAQSVRERAAGWLWDKTSLLVLNEGEAIYPPLRGHR